MKIGKVVFLLAFWLKRCLLVRVLIIQQLLLPYFFLLVVLMAFVSQSRIDWLYQQIGKGRAASVRMSYNPKTLTEKILFTLEQPIAGSTSTYRPCLLHALHALRVAISHSILTDKGHSGSDGRSIVEFWLKQPSVTLSSIVEGDIVKGSGGICMENANHFNEEPSRSCGSAGLLLSHIAPTCCSDDLQDACVDEVPSSEYLAQHRQADGFCENSVREDQVVRSTSISVEAIDNSEHKPSRRRALELIGSSHIDVIEQKLTRQVSALQDVSIGWLAVSLDATAAEYVDCNLRFTDARDLLSKCFVGIDVDPDESTRSLAMELLDRMSVINEKLNTFQTLLDERGQTENNTRDDCREADDKKQNGW